MTEPGIVARKAGRGATFHRVSLLPTETLHRTEQPGRAARPDLIAAGCAVGLVGLAAAIGFGFHARLLGSAHFPGAPTTFGEWPILGEWLPHIGPGTPLA